ncbi:hypothetical protein Q8A73_022674 [Channa argus]|nr:hypothetical protein Q8A73_022674 [Channa argus]
MADRRGNRDKAEDDLPVYLARPGTADQVPRQKHGGLFCSVEGAFESKTIDFDALSVGQRGARTPRTIKREGGQVATDRSPVGDNKSSPAVESLTAAARQGKGASQVEATGGGGKEVLQNLGDEKVPGSLVSADCRLRNAAVNLWCSPTCTLVSVQILFVILMWGDSAQRIMQVNRISELC